ncbi:MAG: matrixin family metalloprotease [Gemmatimonadaceae bacterium]|nr:matrixin family metalloprotease [Gemmatimonadaceae bacterium]
MKTAESALAFCVVGLACFIGGQIVGTRQVTAMTSTGAIVDGAAEHAAAERAGSAEDAEFFGTAAPEMRISDAPHATMPALTPIDLRRRLDQGAAGTYISDLIASRDSAIVRWPDRLTRPLRVWIAEDQVLTGWNGDFLPAIRDAFDTWVQTGIPVHFTFITDSASADVHVRFTERFANGISGKTVWSRDHAWWLVSSDIQLALAHPGGGSVSPPQMRAIALHEIGHLLGLDHAVAPDHIMSARIRVRELTDADRATVRLLYSVPAGGLR